MRARSRRRRTRVGLVVLVSAGTVLAGTLTACGAGANRLPAAQAASGSGGVHPSVSAGAASSGAVSSGVASSGVASSGGAGVPPGPTVSTTSPAVPTTVDPGSLPQTHVLPSSDDPQFLARMGTLCQAIGTGDPSGAQGAFFPLGAYSQVKGISDPVHDYQTRLIPDYDQDIVTDHGYVASTPESASLASVDVPDAAEWILPGVEYNKGSYYRVYGTVLACNVGGQVHTFDIASLISWRGEWYVVHLRSIR